MSRSQVHRGEYVVRLAQDAPPSRRRSELDPQVKRAAAVRELDSGERVRKRHAFNGRSKIGRLELNREPLPRIARELRICLEHHQEDVVGMHSWDRAESAVVAVDGGSLKLAA
jgi:hypothetical protein